ncbi:MAG TPA: aminotransferase class V-fold PLP-dependent enzyme [Terriglobales bacterium]|nr:aminotransferase class V-fold PLP-dependent enzyme [Terriglobales bacterium]
MPFQLDSKTRRELGYRLIDRIDEYFASLPDRPVQLPAGQRTYGPLHNPLPETGDDPKQVLDDLCREMVDKGFHVPSANYFGLMNPTPTYMGFLAEALVAALNPQLATLARSQLASKIELETLRWIGERVGWSGECSGTFTSGGNEANFSGMALAVASAFPDAIEEGMNAITGRPIAYASAEAHHSLDKSAGLLGMGRKGLRRIPVNRDLQLDPERLEEAVRSDKQNGDQPFLVVATAGSTNCGTVDELRKIAEICRTHQLWLHVDGAYGASAIFSDRHRHVVDGIELADSITVDPHKWLAMPFAAGVILTRQPKVLEQAFAVSAPYMPKAAGAHLPDNSRISTQWSRRMNSLKLWLTLRVHGRLAYEEHINRQMKLAGDFANWITSSEIFELAAPQTLPIVAFRLKSRQLTREQKAAAHEGIVEQVTNDGQRWISDTIVNGESALRMMIISYLTEPRHVEDLEIALQAAVHNLPLPTATR